MGSCEKLCECRELLGILRKIDDGSLEVNVGIYEGSLFLTAKGEEICLDSKCNAALITNQGSVDYVSREYLQKAGYSIFPLEKDSFGWLVGGLQTPKGIISWG